MTRTILEKARTRTALEYPFFASILMKRPLTPRKDIYLAAVDGRGRIFYNPDNVEKLTTEQCVHLLCHEVGHVIGLHAVRLHGREHRLWNMAADAWVNDTLVAAGVGEKIDGGVYLPGSAARTVDAIYNDMLKEQQDGGKSQGNQQGKGGADDVGGVGEDLLPGEQPMSQAEQAEVAAEVRVQVAQALRAAKACGKLPGALQEIAEAIIHVPTPWYDIVERYMTQHAQEDYTWRRPNRRFVGAGHYLPSVGTQPRMGELAIIVDISGSVTRRELEHYNGHLARIAAEVRPERVHVLYTDTAVRTHEIVEAGEPLHVRHYSGGGTNLEQAFAYMADNAIWPEVAVCLTDGHTSFDQANAPAYDVIWCMSTDQRAPYGINVPFTVE